MGEHTASGGAFRPGATALALWIALFAVLAGALVPTMAWASDAQAMNRLYNPYTGEHFYTADSSESDNLVALGWRHEGTGWHAPLSGDDVYRLYNSNAGDHHYTTSVDERDHLVSVGWIFEGVGWYSDPGQQVPLYRQYNPNAVAGAHNYTSSIDENDFLVSVGWSGEGIGWYGVLAPEEGDAGASGGQAAQGPSPAPSQDAGADSGPAPARDGGAAASNRGPADSGSSSGTANPAPDTSPAVKPDSGSESHPAPGPTPTPGSTPVPDQGSEPSSNPNPDPSPDPGPGPDPNPDPVQSRQYQIVYRANNGTGDMAPQTVSTGSYVTLSACTFTRGNYVFTGWNTAANGSGAAYADRASVKDLASAGGSAILYAQWAVAKSGWYTEGGKDVYYVDGLMCASQDDVYASAGNGHPAGYRSFKGDGTVNTGWKDDKYYNPSNDGVRVSGHFKVPHSGGANWYYFDAETGVRVTDTWQDKRYFGSDGVRYSGMRAAPGGSLFGGASTYYFDPKNDDVRIENTWYQDRFFGSNGVRYSGMQAVTYGGGTNYYYFDPGNDCVRATNTWYNNRFFGSDGVRYSGMRAVTYGGGTNVYYFDPSNDCVRATNTWHQNRFFGSDGVRYAGYRGVTLNGGTNYYYFDPNNDCVRATNIWWENRFFGSDGVRYSGIRDVTYGGGTNKYYFDPNDDGVRQLDKMKDGYWFHYKTGVGLYFGEYESWQFAQLVIDVYNDYRVNQASTGGHTVVPSDSAWQSEAVFTAKTAAATWASGGHNIKYRHPNWSDILQESDWRKTPWEIISRWIGSDRHRQMMQCESADVCSFGMYNNGAAWFYTLIYHHDGKNQSGD